MPACVDIADEEIKNPNPKSSMRNPKSPKSHSRIFRNPAAKSFNPVALAPAFGYSRQ